jgi:hypothetical protein
MKLESPPKLWIAWFALVVMAIVLSLLFSGCATSTAYTGPYYSTPIVRDEGYLHWDTTTNPREPAWRRRHILAFENPTYRPVAFEVDCKNNFFHVDVAPRTVQRLLLVPEDGSCDIKRVPTP